jgi:leucyl/phenylalanyl-tRNA--protein transferase
VDHRPVTRAYTRLHALRVHSVEVWSGGELVGGLYGIAIGGLFAGESMFHRVTDASKVALVALRQVLAVDGDPRRIIDVQWVTPHLRSLGVQEVPRAAYLGLLRQALEAPLPAPWR